MDSRFDDKSIVSRVISSDKERKNQKLVVLHQNICSLRKKTTELEVLLCSELKHVDVMCLTEHWQSDQKLNCTNIVDFKLVSASCRSSSEHGGSGIYVKDGLETKEISYFAGISEEKIFEMSLIELLIYKLCIVCICKLPDGQFDKSLSKLELVIQKLLMKDKILILCGDWNIDFLHEDSNQKDLTDLLLRYNLVNTVQSPTRITKSTSALIDVIIINKKYYMEPATVIELGFSDHQAQVLSVLHKNHTSVDRRVLKRHFGDDNIREFQYLLKKGDMAGSIFRDRGKCKMQGFYELSFTSF
jgi:exonuclease III